MSGQRHYSCKTCHTEIQHIFELRKEDLVFFVAHPQVNATQYVRLDDDLVKKPALQYFSGLVVVHGLDTRLYICHIRPVVVRLLDPFKKMNCGSSRSILYCV
jgi:hypothetical protein